MLFPQGRSAKMLVPQSNPSKFYAQQFEVEPGGAGVGGDAL
jgi:hypothetical protein